jgi:hypothetical protein
VRTAGGPLRVYCTGASKAEDELLRAEIEQVGNGTWELTLTPKKDFDEVWFPWPQQRSPLEAGGRDELMLYPRLMGVAYAESTLKEWAWKGVDYPGPLFAPLAVTANGHEARLEAAVNWPPRHVTVFFSLERVAFVYFEHAVAGQTQHYRWLVRRVQGDAGAAIEPWQRALDVYRTWLIEHMQAENLYPIKYPEWLLAADGWFNVQLENMRAFDARRIASSYARFRDYFQWVQFWGQMSNYCGPKSRAVPPLAPEEETGCCLAKPELHARYLPDLPRLAEQVAREGRVGFYARPRAHNLVDGSSPEDTAFLLDWLEVLQSQGANAFYVDILGGRYFGEPLKIARLVRDKLPAGVVIEHAVDIYPAAYLISGSLFDNPKAIPGRDLQALINAGSPSELRFERFGRYLLNDRVIFLGESNSDHRGWGPGHDYETERRAFLQGAKLDVIHPAEGDPLTAPMNKAVRIIISERRRVGWWALQPVYLDRQGVRGIPDGVDVRRFRGRDRQTLLVFDNWRRRRNLRIMVDGLETPVPEEALAIRVLPDKGAAVGEAATGRRS